MLLTQPLVAVVNPANVRKVSPEKALVKAKKAKDTKPSAKATKVVSELTALRAELTKLTGAPCSPNMTIKQLQAKIEEAKAPIVEEVEVEAKTRVIPAKPQGIGAFCIAQLKEGIAPKTVLTSALLKFPEAKTSMACVYWYSSKIKAGLL